MVKEAIEDCSITARCGACGTPTAGCGRGPRKISGSAGSITEELRANSHHLRTLAKDIRAAGFTMHCCWAWVGESLPGSAQDDLRKIEGIPS